MDGLHWTSYFLSDGRIKVGKLHLIGGMRRLVFGVRQLKNLPGKKIRAISKMIFSMLMRCQTNSKDILH